MINTQSPTEPTIHLDWPLGPMQYAFLGLTESSGWRSATHYHKMPFSVPLDSSSPGSYTNVPPIHPFCPEWLQFAKHIMVFLHMLCPLIQVSFIAVSTQLTSVCPLSFKISNSFLRNASLISHYDFCTFLYSMSRVLQIFLMLYCPCPLFVFLSRW